MRQAVLLLAGLTMLAAVRGQEPGMAEARLFGAEGHDEATAVWADQAGIFVAGETTSDIVMAAGQALWAPGGPLGRKGFVTAFDTALHWSWSFSFAGDPEAPVDAPSAVAVRDVVRSPGDPAVAWVLYDAPVQGQWESVLLGVHPDEGVVAATRGRPPGPSPPSTWCKPEVRASSGTAGRCPRPRPRGPVASGSVSGMGKLTPHPPSRGWPALNP